MSFTLGILRLNQGYGGVSASRNSASLAGALSARLADQQAETILNRPSTSQRTQDFQTLLSKTSAFEARAAELLSLSSGDSPLAQRAVKSDGDAISGSAVDFAAKRHFSVSVSQLASGQQTISDRLASSADHGLGAGVETVSLGVNGGSVDLDIDLDAATSNRDVLSALADAVNSQDGLGISAQVIDDGGESYLSLSSNSTGAAAAFTLSDQSGTLATDLGLDTAALGDLEAGTGGTVSTARDALFSIDAGATQSSASNTISLFDDQVSLTFASTTTPTEPVNLTVGADGEAVAAAVEDFVAARQDLLAFLSMNPNSATAAHRQGLSLAGDSQSRSLAAIGISQGEDGALSVDRETLVGAIEDGNPALGSILNLARSADDDKRAILDDAARAVTHAPEDVNGALLQSMQHAYQQEELGRLIDPLENSLIKLSVGGIRVQSDSTLMRGVLLDRVA